MPEEQSGKYVAPTELQSPLLKKLDNFWYHYKWPFLGILFTVIVLIVCLVQCQKNGSGDDGCYMYAGGYVLSAEERRNMDTVMKQFSEDVNGDGKIVLGMMNFSIFTSEQIAEYDKNDQAHVAQMSYDNREAFDQEILAGEATLCFLSPALFTDVAKAGGFLPLSEYADAIPAGAEGVNYGNIAYGIKLSSLAIASYPGFSSLPEDTVVCLRTETSMSALFGGESAKLVYDANYAMAMRMLAAEAYNTQK